MSNRSTMKTLTAKPWPKCTVQHTITINLKAATNTLKFADTVGVGRFPYESNTFPNSAKHRKHKWK